MYQRIAKRLVDSLIAGLVLAVFSPLLALITVVLCFLNRGSPFFYQLRLGRNERPFKLLKFRTMTDQRDKAGRLLPDPLRITPVGRWLRRTSVDELPQLWNVLKGEMSLVGPRPLLAEYRSFYTERQRRRHEVRPGITGWAQIHGRNALSWDQKFTYDLEYLDQVTFPQDLRILCKTALLVVRSKNDPPATKFTGTENNDLIRSGRPCQSNCQ